MGRRAPAPVAYSAFLRLHGARSVGQRGGGATPPHHAARMPRRGLCAALRGGGDPRRFVRHCVAVSTLERDLMLDPGGLHHARA